MARAWPPPGFVRRSPGQTERADRDKTVSCSCPAQKSKNFVSRARSRCASRLLPPGSRKVAGPVSASPAPAPSRCAGVGPPVALVCASATATTLPASTRGQRQKAAPLRQHGQRARGKPAFLFGGALLKPVWLGSLPLCVLAALYPVQCRTHYAAEFEDTLACLGGNGGGVLF